MKLQIEHIKDGRTDTVTQEVWDKMTDRGDARRWRIVKRIADMPVEIEKAVRKKKEQPEEDAKEETSTEE